MIRRWLTLARRTRDEGAEMALRRAQHRFTKPLRDRALAQWERRSAGHRLDTSKIFQALGVTPPSNGAELRVRLSDLDRRLRDRLSASLASASTARQLARAVPTSIGDTATAAERLGSGDYRRVGPWLDTPHECPPWHARFGPTGAQGEWPLAPVWELQGTGDTEAGDVRLTWELNRCQWLLTLARQWLHTGDERWATLVVDHMLDWITRNPFLVGVNWLHAQESALRLKAWMWAYAAVSSCPNIDPAGRLTVYGALIQHAEHVQRQLTSSPLTHNHRITELAGLAHWRLTFGRATGKLHSVPELQLLERELMLQFWEDGAPAEGSTGYHLFVLETVCELAAQCAHVGAGLGKRTSARIAAMADFAAHALRPDGTAPRIGDFDDGRGFVLSDRANGEDRRGALGALGLLLDVGTLSPEVHSAAEEAFWLLGPQAAARARRLLPKGPRPRARLFQPAGIAFLHTSAEPGSPRVHASVTGGATTFRAAVSPAHHHAHALSLDIWVDGEPWLVDPGTAYYNGPLAWRTSLRRPSAHSTITAGERDHFDVCSTRFGVWGIQPSSVTAWEFGANWQVVGFRVPAAPDGPEASVLLERRLLFRQTDRSFYVVGFDSWLGQGTCALDQWFQTGPLMPRPDHAASTVSVVGPEGRARYTLAFLNPAPQAHIEIAHPFLHQPGPGAFAHRYGQPVAGWALRRHTPEAALPHRSIWVLAPTHLFATSVPSLVREASGEAIIVPVGQRSFCERIPLRQGRPYCVLRARI